MTTVVKGFVRARMMTDVMRGTQKKIVQRAKPVPEVPVPVISLACPETPVVTMKASC